MAEMTGRRARIVRSGPNGEPKYELRDDKSCFLESLNVHEVQNTLLPSVLILNFWSKYT